MDGACQQVNGGVGILLCTGVNVQTENGQPQGRGNTSSWNVAGPCAFDPTFICINMNKLDDPDEFDPTFLEGQSLDELVKFKNALIRVADKILEDVIRAMGDSGPVQKTDDAVRAVAKQFGIKLKYQPVIKGRGLQDAYGQTESQNTTYLYDKAFESPQRLAATLVHEQVHQADFASGKLSNDRLMPTETKVMSEINALKAEIAWLSKLPGGGGS